MSDSNKTDAPAPLLTRRVLFKSGLSLGISIWAAGCESLYVPDISGVSLDPITPNESFYRQSAFGIPEVDPDTWTFDIYDGDTLLGTIDTDLLASLTPREKEHTLQCIGSSPSWKGISNAIWGGLPLTEVMEAAGIVWPTDALELRWLGYDDYHTSIPATDLDKPIWLVWQMNGEPLPLVNGAPARMLVPNRYGTKNMKWPRELAFIYEPYLGHWEQRGWSNEATYQPNGFIFFPLDGVDVPNTELRILGTAYAGSDPVTLVEFSDDGGATWQEADIDYGAVPDVWTLWSFRWTPPGPGSHALRVRVRTESGAESAEDPLGTDRLIGYDAGMEITVQVIA